MSVVPRAAEERDVPAVVALVNLAYRVEDFFKVAERTDEAEVRREMGRGVYLLHEDEGRLLGSVLVRITPRRGYFGMLSVHPEAQGSGLGRALVRAAEAYALERGCTAMDLSVASPRLELPPWYRKLGYRECGTEPWEATETISQPAHFILMTRSLVEEPNADRG